MSENITETATENITTSNVENIQKRLASKREVHRKVSTKILNTQALVDNYNRLLGDHRELAGRYAEEIDRMVALEEEALVVEKALLEGVKAEDDFYQKYLAGGLTGEELEVRKRTRDRLSGVVQDATTRLKQIEIAVNKIYYGR